MNIYFTLSYRTAEKYQKEINEILSHLQQQKHTVTKRAFRKSDESADTADLANFLDFKTGSFSDVYKTIVKRVREADVVIAETSIPSSSVGYEIAIAQSEKKPTLVLHQEQSMDYLADVFAGNTSKLFQLGTYQSTNDAKSKIDEFLKHAKESIDTKFILIISPKIDRYLEWAAEERRQHKAQIVRDAVETSMEKDKEYQQYLKEME